MDPTHLTVKIDHQKNSWTYSSAFYSHLHHICTTPHVWTKWKVTPHPKRNHSTWRLFFLPEKKTLLIAKLFFYECTHKILLWLNKKKRERLLSVIFSGMNDIHSESNLVGLEVSKKFIFFSFFISVLKVFFFLWVDKSTKGLKKWQYYDDL